MLIHITNIKHDILGCKEEYNRRNVKILYLDIYELLMVNYVAVTEKI